MPLWRLAQMMGKVGGFLVEKGTPSFETSIITGKIAKRAVWQWEAVYTYVGVDMAQSLIGGRKLTGFQAFSR